MRLLQEYGSTPRVISDVLLIWNLQDYSPMTIQQILPLTLVGYAASTVVSHIDPISGHHLAMPILYTATAVQGMGALLGLIVSSPCLCY